MEVAIQVTTRHFQNIYGQLGSQETFRNLSSFRFNTYKKFCNCLKGRNSFSKVFPAQASTGGLTFLGRGIPMTSSFMNAE